MDRPLATVFAEAQAIHDALEEGHKPRQEAEIQKCLNLLEEVAQEVYARGVLSPNEVVDDVNTSDLKYVLVPFYQGEVMLHRMEQRLDALKAAEIRFREFLQRCERLQLVSGGDVALLHPEGPVDPATMRTQKITRFKKQRAAEEKLKRLMERKRARGDAENDEELERDLILTLMGISSHRAIEHVGMIKQEVELLEHAASLRGPEGQYGKEGPSSCPKQSECEGKPTLEATQILPGGVMRRVQMKREVFRDPNPYTMTIEEALQREMAQGGVVQGGHQPRNETNPDDMTEVDRETEKASKWDDWKDEHPRGDGNKNDNYFKRSS
eukprot:TRINITY_DN1198_c0_g1_i4.p2 TRINITY_DN1198_c0_g1~~TRINITY_DN1198_c0_g1_i4.p2  ORF type:complete len:325 (-),score=78.05 TRINITY_DN1198_c0_g1_i4:1065-2039(-)